jgi:hypothetical protein
MSAYEVAKFCRRCLREPALRQAVLDDPRAALADADLSDAERDALLAGDVGALYRAGCSAFLLSYLPRWNLFGLDIPTYAERIRASGEIASGT